MARRLLDAEDASILPPAQLANGGARALRRRYNRLVVIGSPPQEEIGYWLAPILALASRPKQVTLVDWERDAAATDRLSRYLVRAAPFAVEQLLASAVAIALQGGVTPLAQPRRLRLRGDELKTLIYLRPAVGATSAYGGSVTHAHGVVRALQAEGVQVHAFTTDRRIALRGGTAEGGVDWRVLRTPRALRALPASAALGGDAAILAAAVRAAKDADAIYQRHARFSLAGALLARATGLPLFLEYNGSEEFISRHWNPTPLRKRLAVCEETALRAAARIVVVSDADRRLLVTRGIAPGRILLNPNGVDVDLFGKGGGGEVRRAHALEPDALVVGFVGTFGPWHGAEVLARAFADVAPNVPELHLLLVGEGEGLEKSLAILRAAGVKARTTPVGPVPPGDVPRYLDACDILVAAHVPLPDGVEFFGSPTKLFEYMAAGKAIVASSLGQIGEVLSHGETAWLVTPGDAGELAEGVRHLAAHSDLRNRLGAQARRRAAAHHTWKENAGRILEAYRALVAEKIN